MALFIDSSDPKEIKDLFAWGVLSGVTTNPLIIAKEAPDADLGERIREVLAVSWGDVSVELTTETENEMLEESQLYHAWDPAADHHQGALQRDRPPRASPAREERRQDERDLPDGDEPGVPGRARRRDVRQHLQRPRARHGLRRAAGHRGDARTSSTARGSPSKIIVGSMRHMMDVNEALECGAHVPDRDAADPAQDGLEPAHDRDDQRVQHRLARPPQEEVTERSSDVSTRSPDWNGKHVLVTGGAGFIGSHVADARSRAARASRCSTTSRRASGSSCPTARRASASSRATCSTRRSSTSAMRGVDFVFHLAANADIKDNLNEPRKCVDQNVVATQNVLEAMRAAGTQEIAFSSTGSVYGEATVIPTPEDAPFPVQTSLYATSKVAAEGLLTSYALGSGVPDVDLPLRVAARARATRTATSSTSGASCGATRRASRCSATASRRRATCTWPTASAAMFVAVEKAREPINVFNLGHD